MDVTYILVLVAALFSIWASIRVNTTYNKYEKVRSMSGLTGAMAAERILHSQGIYDVRVEHVSGKLTDHYDPSAKVLRLSDSTYGSSSVAAVGVAAHECGHALQHAQAYSMLQLRSALVPVVSFASHWVQWILLAGILLVDTFPNLLLIGIALFAMTTLFSIITLPVEIDASHRALAWLRNSGITTYESQESAKDALKWAAYTYVIAALSSLATLLYYIMIYLGRRE